MSASMAFPISASDEQYLAALASGNEAAFEVLFTHHYPSLRRYAATLLRYPSDAAEDAVTEVFCTLWANRARLAVAGSLAACLYTTLRYRAFDRLREQRRTPLDAPDELLQTQPAAEH